MEKKKQKETIIAVVLCAVVVFICIVWSNAKNTMISTGNPITSNTSSIGYSNGYTGTSSSSSKSSTSSSSSKKNTSKCQFKYPNGTVCGASLNKYSNLCDYHYDYLNDSYNYVKDRMNGLK